MSRVQTPPKGKMWWKEMDIVDWINGALFFVVLGIVPFIVRTQVLATSEDELQLVRSQKYYADFFSYRKAQTIIAVAMLLLVCNGIAYVITEKKTPFMQWLRRPQTICALVFGGFVLLSTVFSAYQTVVYDGATSRFEGFYMLLSYMVLFLTAQTFARTALKCRWILYSILFSAAVVGLIGTFQYFGHDFFKTPFAYHWVVPAQLRNDIPNLKVNFEAVYTTLFNPNCVGLYTALLFPLTAILGVGLPLRDKTKYAFLGVAVLLFFCLIGSESEGGYIGVASALVALCLLGMIFGMKGKLKPVQIYLVLAGVLLLPPIFVIGITPLRSKVLALVERYNHIPANYYTAAKVENNQVTVQTTNGPFSIMLSQEDTASQTNGGSAVTIQIKDSAGNPVKGTMTQEPIPEDQKDATPFQRLDFTVEGIGTYDLRFNGMLFILETKTKDFVLCFGRKDIQTLQLLDLKLKPVPESVAFVGSGKYDAFASNRGYIWSRALPLVAKHWLIGAGPDTFSLDFPQGDIHGKLKYFGDPYIIVDKAHNIYLQTAMTTGGISLLAMVTLFGFYLCGTVRQLVQTHTQQKMWVVLAVACFCSVVGYMVAGMATDSVVSVSPLFWTLLGLGFAVNEKLKAEQ